MNPIGSNRTAGDTANQKRRICFPQMGFLLAAVMLLSVLGIRFFGTTAQADESNCKRERYYTSILIEFGDTLWSIAEKYTDPEYESVQDYVNELKFMNNLTTSDIYTGQYLTIAYYK